MENREPTERERESGVRSVELVLSVAVSLWRFNGLLTGFLSVACAAAAPATRS